ncbi:MAG: NUDIX domain-containing protein [Chloroflexota bacterium]|nr:NUDIX domain-containing protein [Chloroflexota bacterium]
MSHLPSGRTAASMGILSHDIYQNIRTRTIVLHQGRILLLPAEKEVAPGVETVWRLPGGGLEPHETLAECARREVLEETGIWVRVGRIAFLLEWVVPRYAPVPEPGDGYGFGLEVFHYATPEEPIGELRAEEPRLVPPQWVRVEDVPDLPL